MVENILKYDLKERFKAILNLLDSTEYLSVLRPALDTSPNLRKELEAIRTLNTKLTGVSNYPSDDEFIELLILEYQAENYNIF